MPHSGGEFLYFRNGGNNKQIKICEGGGHPAVLYCGMEGGGRELMLFTYPDCFQCIRFYLPQLPLLLFTQLLQLLGSIIVGN